MKFRARILATLAVPLTLVVALGGAAALGVAWLDRGIAGYIAHEDALARAAAEMYAQGLQTGQAIRNIILEPANPKAYENRKAAVADYDKAREAAEAAAQTPEQKSLMARIGELRAAHAKVQDEVEALVKADPKDVAPAVAKLRAAETPAWRKLKDELLALKAKATADMTAERDGAMAGMRRARNFVLALTVTCFVACAFFARGLVSYVDREIGGEPSEAREALKRIEAGDLASPVVVRPGDDHSVMSAVAHMRERLLGLVTQVSGTAHFVAGASDRIAEGNADLSARTEAQASAIEQTSATMEQLTATVKENAAHAQDADRIAKEAAAVAHEGGEVVAKVADSMKGMTDNSNRIREIIGVIDAIAFQTNILALNASVESARAGEQGKGFAVVASEVRALASRSAEAAREIKDLIGASVERAEQGAALAGQANADMERVVESIRNVSRVVEQISLASAEQSSGVAQMGQAVHQMDQVTQKNAAMVEASTEASETLRKQAHALEDAMAAFRTGATARA